ncbi:DNA repair protein RecN [Psychrobacter phenylpyruvicus]|uniref:DNA repair protein RecN n=1 Tax=Psychrobacter phenylpyruvicus TaxID=29432 RepID=A0A379LQ35_9GAMM|nr:DNA repair protein RecN [Psychrobacter phenylpyruvicus]SUD91922.1 Recombination protein N [Psychrobacter phenylpyruvicus]
MLTSLTLQNFALINHHELSFYDGFNVITGETGAGKSLLLDALSLCIGGRADTSMVRHGKDHADIYAQFEFAVDASSASTHNTNTAAAVRQWFESHDREFESEVLIRRQLSSNGRSKAWLNGAPVSLTELKELGSMLVNIHSQHAQQALLKPSFVVEWLDSIAGLQPLANQTEQAYKAYQRLKRQAEEIAAKEAHRNDRIELLNSQLADISPLLAVDYEQIEAEHDELSNLEALMLEASHAVQLLDNDSDDPDAMDLLGKAIRLCENQSEVSATFSQASESLYLAQQHVSEAVGLLADYAEQQLPDPERLEELNTLISLGHRLSRKHGLPAINLVEEAQVWQEELDNLVNQPTSEVLEAQINDAWQDFTALATELGTVRQQVAPSISAELVAQLQPLALPNARCEFVFTERAAENYNAQGKHDIELMFSANVGMPMQPLYKIASGGELSRMALVMQVLLATHNQQPNQADTTETDANISEPMLVFDEVDVGISGGTAQVVGELLRQLGTHRQLLAITHQAQVAAQAHQHILVQKHHDTDEGQTTSQINVIENEAQVDELARMSGGVNITEVTREHARSLLADVNK